MSQEKGLETRKSGGKVTRRLGTRIGRKKENTNIRLRCIVTYALLGIVGINNLAVLTIIVLVGLGVMTLDIKVVLSLIGETVAQAAGLFCFIIRDLFPNQSG